MGGRRRLKPEREGEMRGRLSEQICTCKLIESQVRIQRRRRAKGVTGAGNGWIISGQRCNFDQIILPLGEQLGQMDGQPDSELIHGGRGHFTV